MGLPTPSIVDPVPAALGLATQMDDVVMTPLPTPSEISKDSGGLKDGVSRIALPQEGSAFTKVGSVLI
jgi:hypothetical protein